MRKIIQSLLCLLLPLGVFSQPGAFYHTLVKTTIPTVSPFQPETDAYMALVISSGGIWDSTGYKAIDTLVRDLKGLTNPLYPTSNIWPSFIDILPIYGGTPTAHSYNLVNPALYNMTYVGSPVHSSSGISFNGTTQHANTHLSQGLLSYSNNNAAIYTDIAAVGGNHYLFGTYDGGNGVFGFSKDNINYFVFGRWGDFSTSGTGTPMGNFTAIDYSSSSRLDLYKNGVTVANSVPVNIPATQDIYLACLNQSGSPIYRATMVCKFFGICNTTLTSTQNLNYYYAVSAYQNRLSRP